MVMGDVSFLRGVNQREKMSICRDLNPRPFKLESSPLTTRPGHLKLLAKIENDKNVFANVEITLKKLLNFFKSRRFDAEKMFNCRAKQAKKMQTNFLRYNLLQLDLAHKQMQRRARLIHSAIG